MRLRRRVLIISLCLSLLCASLLSSALTVSGFRADLARELERGRAARDMYIASLKSSAAALSGLDSQEGFLRAARISAQYMGAGWVGLLSPQGQLLYDNFPQAQASLLDRMPTLSGQRLFSLQDREYQLLRSEERVGEHPFWLLFAWDVSAIYAGARAQARAASLMLLALCLLLALGLYLALRRSFQPLERLEGAAHRIAQGDYAARAPQGTGADEVGRLSLPFNHMAQATQGHIQRLTAQDAQQKQFIADMAHEMKTPMTSIIGYADLLQRGSLSEGQRQQALQSIQGQGERLERMAHKLLRLSRLEGSEKLDLQPCEAEALFAQAVEAVAGQVQERGVLLHVNEQGQRWPCDSDLMVTLIVNLLSNAIKFSPQGGQVWLAAGEEGFSVRDEGCGIPAQHLPHVQATFYMVDSSRARSQLGAALGLSLCRRIAQLHGARLEIESEENKGTQVSLIFTSL